MKRLLLGFVVASTILGCQEVLPVGPSEVVDEASDEAFVLVIRSPADRVAPGQPLEVVAEVVYQGTKNRERVFHGGSPVGWQIVQLDGNAVMDGFMEQPCLHTDMQPGEVLRYPFRKSGILAGPFDQAWFADPALRLPAGRWRFVANLLVSLDDCGGESHPLEATIDVAVGG